MSNKRKNVRAAIVGCGIIFPYHAFSIEQIEGVDLVAICDTDINSLKRATQTYKCEEFKDFEQMIDNVSIDTLHICTPHYLHFPMYIKAMEKGINVIIEKPVAIKRSEIKKMVSNSIKAKTIDAGIFQNRFTRSSKIIKNAIEKQRIGAIKYCDINITANVGQYNSWRKNKCYSGGGILLDFAIHYVDLVKWFLNMRPTGVEVLNKDKSQKNNDMEDTIEGIIHFDNNFDVFFYIRNQYLEESHILITIKCEKGTAYFSGDHAKIRFNSGAEIEGGLKKNDFFVYDNIGKRYWGMGHLEQIKNYYNSLKLNIKPAVDLIDACESVEIILDIYERLSIKTETYF